VAFEPDGPGLTITYEIDFPHPVVGRQSLTVPIRPEEYSARIAPARTFGSPETSRRCAPADSPGRQPAQRGRPRRERRRLGPAAVPRRVRPAQDPGPRRRPRAAGPPALRPHLRPQGRARSAYRVRPRPRRGAARPAGSGRLPKPRASASDNRRRHAGALLDVSLTVTTLPLSSQAKRRSARTP
jgi:hypothetical protein